MKFPHRLKAPYEMKKELKKEMIAERFGKVFDELGKKIRDAFLSSDFYRNARYVADLASDTLDSFNILTLCLTDCLIDNPDGRWFDCAIHYSFDIPNPEEPEVLYGEEDRQICFSIPLDGSICIKKQMMNSYQMDDIDDRKLFEELYGHAMLKVLDEATEKAREEMKYAKRIQMALNPATSTKEIIERLPEAEKHFEEEDPIRNRGFLEEMFETRLPAGLRGEA